MSAVLREYFDHTADTVYFQNKLEDHRTFTALMCVLFAILASALWVWDYVTDPVGAADTVLPRLAYLLLALGAPVFLYVKPYRFLAWQILLTVWLSEAHFVHILTRLQGGMAYGMAGFVYFLFLPLVVCLGFSLRFNLVFIVTTTALPQLMWLAGWAPGFQNTRYAVLVWPGAMLVLVIAGAFARSYRRRYLTERALERASNTDSLTGASNRRHFEELLSQEMARCERMNHTVSLLMLDIDHFKKINDSHGHPTGDRVIQALSNTCREMSRAIDEVARIGGEEFAILLPGADSQGAQVAAERILARVRALVMHSQAGLPMHWTVSIGVATRRPLEPWSTERPGEMLIAHADAALYEAKHMGRNRVVSASPLPLPGV
ncbi:GGDEF domain-containing protein [Rhodoferax sp.]|uniref:GGDEF domain-containing protein n=1 Tax=Rhodoferax sp. TaxID=50421 RepID=UPI0025D6E280|nr:GGDEF domain-containing protein [Rhodoferax sp.]